MRAGAAVIALWLCGLTASTAGEPASEAAVQAAYLYRFAGYVEWPKDSVAGGPFVIAVIDAPAVARELRRLMPQHPVNEQTVQVREVARVRDLNGAQIVFVGPGHGELLRQIAAANRPMLLVTDDERALDEGSMLNFVMIDKHIRFEVSLSAAEHAGIKISSELLSVAVRVRGAGHQSDDLCIPFALPEEAEDRCGIRQATRFSSRPLRYPLQSSIRGAAGSEQVCTAA